MSTKTLNTRIQSKIDTLENWNKSTLPLLAGEIAIATGAVKIADGLTEPVCIIRIGEDGKKTFSQLPDALHAKAIDVLPICKDTEALKTFIMDTFEESDLVDQMGQFFQDLKYEDTAVDGEYVSAVSQENGIISVTRTALPDFLQDISIEIGEHDSIKDCIILKNKKGDILSYANASQFVKDGMLDSAVYDETTHTLSLTWNTDSGKSSVTEIDLSDLVNIYTGSEGITVEGNVIKFSQDFAEGFQELRDSATSAIQTISSNAIENNPSGLKVVKNNTNYDIAIDDSITFIFNCGDAEVTTSSPDSGETTE